MEKQEVIQLFKAGHQRMVEVVQKLSGEQMMGEKIFTDWTVKDILAHLGAWSWEAQKEIDRVLQDQPTWHKRFAKGKGEDAFNKEEVAKRRGKSLGDVIREWEESFELEMGRLSKLSEEEWTHQSKGDKWEDGTPVTVSSLYKYEYEGENHEAAHAKQIEKHFGLS